MPVAYEWSYNKEYWLIFCELIVYAGGAPMFIEADRSDTSKITNGHKNIRGQVIDG
jgi:hypothetical protein